MVARSFWKKVLGAALIGVVTTVGCRQIAGLDGYEYVESLCTADIHCDDLNPCTTDVCGEDSECAHEPAPDGVVPDGVQGNCKLISCSGGQPSAVFFADDLDDGNDCTQDACSEGVDATHTNLPNGATCAFQGALGTCDGEGSCTAECGFVGEDGAEVGCDPAPDACTLSFCDKSKGACVTEKLDGIPAPGTPEPGECGGTYCIDGVVSPQTADMGTPCLQTEGPTAGQAGVCTSGGACVGCNNKLDCQDAIPESECHQWVCMGGTCMNSTEPDGPLMSQVIGDCHTKLCTNGIFIDQVDDGDIEDDGEECTTDICANGTPDHVNKVVNTPCGGGGLLYCDGMGTCKGCTLDVQCLGGTECKTPKCDVAAGDCFLENEPAGKVIMAQSAGDCTNNVCDATGNITTAYNPADPENDSADCTADTCVAMNQTSHTPVALGSGCNDGGGIVCDGAAHCVGKPCSVMGDCPGGTFCVDGVCCDSSCGGTCNACTSAKKGAGPNGLCGVILAGDPDAECPGVSSCASGVCNGLPNGSPCVGIAGECMSGFCADGVCCNAQCNGTCLSCSATPGTCTPIANGQDPANECASGACDGTGACRKNNGQVCATGADCLSTICTDGVCCNNACGGLCQACNVAGSLGACTNVPNNTDPANECVNGSCNGGAECKLTNGQGCGSGGDCLSTFCADGVCCNSACGATCQACTAAKTGGADGTCSNVTAATDPDVECVGVTNCNGSGACTKLTNGTACTLGGECQSGNCVDGVCCNTTCTAGCNACNVGGSVGTCTAIPIGTDPGNDCNGNAGADVCNGAGACKEVNGTGCSAGSECLSAACVDGVCCNNTCTGTCQACNVAGSLGTCSNIMNGQDPSNDCAGATTCNGAGACTKLANGSACTTNGAAGECMSTFCVDGVCCNAACGGTCQACTAAKNGGVTGTCSPVPIGMDPDTECTGNGGNDVCNGAGACKEVNGTACMADSECVSGECVDGVCCNVACDGACEACSSAKTGAASGTCAPVAIDTDPDNECGGAQVCNIMGMCVGGPNGLGCTLGTECGSTHCIDNVCCNTDCTGTCNACSTFKKGSGTNGTCGPIGNTLDPDLECAGDHTCNGASACTTGAGANGDACANGTTCASGFCIDSVCCDNACTGLCKACSTFKKGSGANGTCDFINAGTDSDGECSGANPNCNGAGMCGP